LITGTFLGQLVQKVLNTSMTNSDPRISAREKFFVRVRPRYFTASAEAESLKMSGDSELSLEGDPSFAFT
jgi:hypothetical protein